MKYVQGTTQSFILQIGGRTLKHNVPQYLLNTTTVSGKSFQLFPPKDSSDFLVYFVHQLGTLRSCRTNVKTYIKHHTAAS